MLENKASENLENRENGRKLSATGPQGGNYYNFNYSPVTERLQVLFNVNTRKPVANILPNKILMNALIILNV